MTQALGEFRGRDCEYVDPDYLSHRDRNPSLGLGSTLPWSFVHTLAGRLPSPVS